MPAAAKIKTIVVDDQMTMRSLVRTSLQQLGIVDIREFPGAVEAMQAIKAPSAVGPRLQHAGDGRAGICRNVRADATTRNSAFILLTGRADKDLVQRAAQFGANNYLVKPFTIAVLKQKLEQIFGALV